MQQVILIAIMLAVLVGIPWLLARKSKRNPMEIIFGARVNKTPFGKKDTEKEADQAPKAPVSRNSSKNDLLETISSLVSYARRNHFYSLVPGTLALGEDTGSLAVLMVTRSGLLGFNCFGYAGQISGKRGDENWVQVLPGESASSFKSPSVKNRAQEELLQKILADAGLHMPVKVIGVFTARDLKLSCPPDANCFSRKALTGELARSQYLRDGGVDPKKTGTILERYKKTA